MKYTITLEIAVQRDKLVKLYLDPANWSKWQEGLVTYEILSGENRQAGSKTKLVNRFGKKEIEILETVEVNQLPDVFTCTYEAVGAWNRVENRFTSVTPDKTKWEFSTEFKCRGMLKLKSIIVPGMFRKSSLKEMEAFKKFAEQSENCV